MPVDVAGDDVRVVGSSDDWVMAVKETDGECFLVNAFSSEVVHLPPLRSCDYSWLVDALVVRTSFLGTSNRQPWMHCSAVLSASPSSGSKYIVAALCFRSNNAAKFLGLALWQPGMTSWNLCRSGLFDTLGNDLAFYQGKLYLVWKTRPRIFAYELREDEHGVSLSCPQQYMIELCIVPYNPSGWVRCNMVVWRGKLLLIIRFFRESHKKMVYKPHSIQVFTLDFSTNPYGVTQIHNFEGDCIFVQKIGCRSVTASSHLGVQGDLIYFSDECIDNCFPYVYNMRDGGTTRCFAADLPPGVRKESCLDFPVWIFPS